MRGTLEIYRYKHFPRDSLSLESNNAMQLFYISSLKNYL